MKLWHQKLIPHLPKQQLMEQYHELCTLRGEKWECEHSVTNYVFEHKIEMLIAYHYLVINEMQKRGYNPDKTWQNANYRGEALGIQENWCDYRKPIAIALMAAHRGRMIYPEHNDEYLQECINDLKEKGVACIGLN